MDGKIKKVIYLECYCGKSGTVIEPPYGDEDTCEIPIKFCRHCGNQLEARLLKGEIKTKKRR